MFSLTNYAPTTMLETSARNIKARQLYTAKLFRSATNSTKLCTATVVSEQPITPSCLNCTTTVTLGEFNSLDDKEEYVTYGLCRNCQTDDWNEQIDEFTALEPVNRFDT